MNFLDILLDTLLDAVKMYPFMLAAFAVIELVERRASLKMRRALSGRAGVGAGALLGCFPQCGFSVMAANLYGERLISLGTLMAVFLSTSDEALIVLLTSPGRLLSVLLLIGVKIAVGVIAGYAIDALIKPKIAPGQGETHRGCHGGVFMAALKHSLSLLAFVLVITLALNTLISAIGQDALSSLLMANTAFQPALTALIGLIPNCAASILIMELYLAGGISFGSVVAGLCAGAGAGLLVLFKSNKSTKQNIAIAAGLFLIGALVGMAIDLAGISNIIF